MFLPPFGATSIPMGSPLPGNSGVAFAKEIEVFPGFNPIRTVSGFSSSDPVTR